MSAEAVAGNPERPVIRALWRDAFGWLLVILVIAAIVVLVRRG